MTCVITHRYVQYAETEFSNYSPNSYASQSSFGSSTALNNPRSPRQSFSPFSSHSSFSPPQLGHYTSSWAGYGSGSSSGIQTLQNSPAFMHSLPPVHHSNPVFHCRWAGCTAGFWAIEQLVYHVNTAHLQSQGSHPQASAIPDSSLLCLWDNCDMWRWKSNV